MRTLLQRWHEAKDHAKTRVVVMSIRLHLAPLALAFGLAAACGGSSSGPESPGNALDEDAGAPDAGDAVDAAAPGDATFTADTGATVDARPSTRPLRFIAIGDTGTGSTDQKKVGDAMKAKCDASGCDLVVMLGDNFYDSGVTSVTDPQWVTKFEQPYASVNVPFWVVLGNHDYGANGAGTDFARPDNQLAYARTSPKFRMPARHWHRIEGPVEFFGLDTNEAMFNRAATQKSNVRQWIASSTARWKIALGHHPYLSNGPHGNAGRYEGIPGIPVVSGGEVKSFFDDTICGKVDVYLCGHDHSRQYLQGKCGTSTELIVSGAGAKVTELKGSNPTHYQAATIGFVYVVVDDSAMTIEFVDGDGRSEYTRTIRK
jgi:tartrate-resistant acid phosphatase type 5